MLTSRVRSSEDSSSWEFLPSELLGGALWLSALVGWGAIAGYLCAGLGGLGDGVGYMWCERPVLCGARALDGRIGVRWNTEGPETEMF